MQDIPSQAAPVQTVPDIFHPVLTVHPLPLVAPKTAMSAAVSVIACILGISESVYTDTKQCVINIS